MASSVVLPKKTRGAAPLRTSDIMPLLGLFQNPVGFGTGLWKNRSEPGFSAQTKEAVQKLKFLNSPVLP
jgi:hypothetical protein